VSKIKHLFLGLMLLLASCATPTPKVTPTSASPTQVTPSATRRIQMIPTWTPSPTQPRKATPTPRNTSTPLTALGGVSGTLATSIPTGLSTEMLLDRPTNVQLAKPTNLVSMQYNPSVWMLNSFYPTSYMGYSLNHRAIYGCKLEPSIGKGVEGYEVEQYKRTYGLTTFEVARFSQAGELVFANYCTGSGEDHTCYQITPGADHADCIQAAEEVLATFKLIPNPFFGRVISSPNRWGCQDQAGMVGLCLISFSVPLNALAFSSDGQAWAAGDDGIILHREGQAWKEVNSPATHPLYDLSFSSPVNGWAVGAGAEVLQWDGNEWSETLPYHGPGEGPGGSTQVLYAVEAYSSDNVWMVGAMKGIDGKNSPYALHWDGTKLVEENTFPECNCGLNAVLVRGRDDVFAAGGSDLGAIIFHWDGTAWSSTMLTGADHLYALKQAMNGTLWVAGMEVARDLSDTRGVLFQWDGARWQRIALPPITGGIYALSVLPTGQIVIGGDFSALQSGQEWQPITTDIAAFGAIEDIEQDPQGNVWALTHSGDIFKLGISH
jgi:hypothetical protein